MKSPMQTRPNHCRRSAGRCSDRNRSSIMTGSSICAESSCVSTRAATGPDATPRCGMLTQAQALGGKGHQRGSCTRPRVPPAYAFSILAVEAVQPN